MSKKLNATDSISSIDACVSYTKKYPSFGKKHVIASGTKGTIFNDLVTVNIAKTNIYCNVNIMWDERMSEKEYKENGLYGYYSTMYYRMCYSKGLLVIKSDDIKIEIHE